MAERSTAVEVDVTRLTIVLHVMVEGGPPYDLSDDETAALAVDLHDAYAALCVLRSRRAVT